MPGPNAFGVNEKGYRIIVLLQNRPGDFVLRFPAVIESDDRALGRNSFLAPTPGQEILHRDDSNALFLKLFHLLLKERRRDLGVRPFHDVHKPVIPEDDDLSVLVDDRLADDRRRGW